MKCECGKEKEKADLFCSNCGFKFSRSSTHLLDLAFDPFEDLDLFGHKINKPWDLINCGFVRDPEGVSNSL